MKIFIYFIAVLHVVFGQDYVSGSSSSASNNFEESISDFTIAFYEEIISGQNGNLIMSPFSAQTALSLLYCGAAGETATIMANALDFKNENRTEIINQYHTFLTPVQNNPSFSIANAIYVMQDYTIQSDYKKIASTDFYAKVASVDFSQSVSAANTINQWVADETHDKITNLIAPSDLDSNTRSVLLNAVYFKGTWKYQFEKFRTHLASFYSTSKSTVQVPMMHITQHLYYAYNNQLNAQIIEIPYSNSDVSMVIILPQSVDGLPALQQALKTYNLLNINEELYNQKVILSLPKFKIETTLNLNDPLTKLGFGTIFNDADFTNMLTDSSGMKVPIEVSKVVQKAYIEVDETGTTAAAATGIIMFKALAIMYEPPPVVFDANHPFVFLLMTPSAVIFIGNYNGQ